MTNIFSAIQRLTPKAGDVLLFYAESDENGNFICDMETYRDCFNRVSAVLEDGVAIVMIPDKISLFSVERGQEMIRSLENCISAIQEAMDKAGDIKNGEKSAVVKIDLKKAEGPV